ncbi:hypothetical protein KVP10_19465 [Candidimonas humi]|uniref:precorrin-2 dehydrogenase n=1 Tax=Candidimonas humi TaxID=683355 RepID=A0ABV8NSF9_9BURK|nr:NAD(P)-dependent oxidoreductase [Candidimonas humi]MBV6307074.1 hypothetical protein [Candidimonas humi]
MRLFPMFCDVRGRDALVVGGGPVAWRKAALLLEAGARVHVGAPQLCGQLQELAGCGALLHLPGAYSAGWLDGKCLVIAATDERAVNAQVARDAGGRGLWVNVVDDAELSSFHVPAIVDRAPLTLAISSGGTAPVLARRLRERLESLLDPSLSLLAELAQRYRPRIRARYPDVAQRRRFYEWMCDGPVAAIAQGQGLEPARSCLDRALQEPRPRGQGTVCFLDAGEGDPELLTLKGLRALSSADLIIHEPLPDASLLAMARRDADREAVDDLYAPATQPVLGLALARVESGARLVCVFRSRREAAHRLQRELEAQGYACCWIPAAGVSGVEEAAVSAVPG